MKEAVKAAARELRQNETPAPSEVQSDGGQTDAANGPGRDGPAITYQLYGRSGGAAISVTLTLIRDQGNIPIKTPSKKP